MGSMYLVIAENVLYVLHTLVGHIAKKQRKSLSNENCFSKCFQGTKIMC